MTSHDLRGLNVVVTRPREQAQELIDAILQENGQAISFPTLEISAVTDKTALISAIKLLVCADMLIFVSHNAVKYSMPDLLPQQQLINPRCLYAAVGAGTVKSLQHYGINQVIYPLQQVGSQALLTLPAFDNIKDKHIIIFCGENASDFLPTELRRRGAIVVETPVYRASLPNRINADAAAGWRQAGINVIVSTSIQSLQNLMTMQHTSLPTLQENITLIVISERMLSFAKLAGFQHVLCAENAGTEAIIAVLKQYQEVLYHE